MPALNPDALHPGARLDDYELESVLLSGDFSVVYRARREHSSRWVTVEEYLPAALATRGSDQHLLLRNGANAAPFERGLQAFLAEAEMLGGCDHPALPEVKRWWRANGTAYREVSYVQATSLRLLRDGMVEPPDEEALGVVVEGLLGALEELHAAGYVHGAISAHTVMLRAKDDSPMLTVHGAAQRAVLGDGGQAVLRWLDSPSSDEAAQAGPWIDVLSVADLARFCIDGRFDPRAPAAQPGAPVETLSASAAALERRFPGLRYSRPFIAALEWTLASRSGDRPESVAEFRAALARPTAIAPVLRGPAVPGLPEPQRAPPPVAKLQPVLPSPPPSAPAMAAASNRPAVKPEAEREARPEAPTVALPSEKPRAAEKPAPASVPAVAPAEAIAPVQPLADAPQPVPMPEPPVVAEPRNTAPVELPAARLEVPPAVERKPEPQPAVQPTEELVAAPTQERVVRPVVVPIAPADAPLPASASPPPAPSPVASAALPLPAVKPPEPAVQVSAPPVAEPAKAVPAVEVAAVTSERPPAAAPAPAPPVDRPAVPGISTARRPAAAAPSARPIPLPTAARAAPPPASIPAAPSLFPPAAPAPPAVAPLAPVAAAASSHAPAAEPAGSSAKTIVKAVSLASFAPLPAPPLRPVPAVEAPAPADAGPPAPAPAAAPVPPLAPAAEAAPPPRRSVPLAAGAEIGRTAFSLSSFSPVPQPAPRLPPVPGVDPLGSGGGAPEAKFRLETRESSSPAGTEEDDDDQPDRPAPLLWLGGKPGAPGWQGRRLRWVVAVIALLLIASAIWQSINPTPSKKVAELDPAVRRLVVQPPVATRAAVAAAQEPGRPASAAGVSPAGDVMAQAAAVSASAAAWLAVAPPSAGSSAATPAAPASSESLPAASPPAAAQAVLPPPPVTLAPTTKHAVAMKARPSMPAERRASARDTRPTAALAACAKGSTAAQRRCLQTQCAKRTLHDQARCVRLRRHG